MTSMVEREEIDRLREALRFYACDCSPDACETGCTDDVSCGATAKLALSASLLPPQSEECGK